MDRLSEDIPAVSSSVESSGLDCLDDKYATVKKLKRTIDRILRSRYY